MDAARQTMDFFGHQDRARRQTGRLVLLYIVAVVLICGAVATVAVVMAAWTRDGEQVLAIERAALVALGAAAATAALIGGGSLYRIAQLRGGGSVVADALGGRLISASTTDPAERRALHVVEEMAIASGVPVPPVYIMAQEGAINAFAAGYSPGDAVIGLTRGCVDGLTREELQGVVAHEFSHILNGDMRLNIRLIGLLNGIVLLSLIGTMIVRSLAHSRPRRSGSNEGGGGVLLVLAVGVALLVIGSLGSLMARVIQAAVSRQREFLADASAVQFTRNPEGLAGALRRIGGASRRGRLTNAHAGEMNHMFFGESVRGGMLLGSALASHPPLPKRIRRVDPSWDGTMLTPLAPEPERATEGRAASGREQVKKEGVAAAAALMAMVGTATPAHLEHAQGLVEAIPRALREAAREPFGAVTVVYALLLDRREDVRAVQVGHLAKNAERGVAEAVGRLAVVAAGLDRALRLPLLDTTLGALAGLSPEQHAAFRGHVRALTRADRSIDLFEWVTVRALERHLDERFGLARPAATQYYALHKLEDRLSVLLSALAHAGTASEGGTEAAFGASWAALGQRGVRLLAPAECGLGRLDEALGELRTVSAPLKRRILTACAVCVASDHAVTAGEAELLRAVADTLGVPAPPLLPGQALI